MTYESFPLGEVANLQAGYGFPVDLQGRTNGDYPFAKVGDISRCGRSSSSVLTSADHFIDEKDLVTLRAKLVPQGSVLFAKIGEAIRQNHRVVAGRDMLIDNNAMAAIPGSRIDSRFLYHYLKTVDFYRLAPATTVPALRKSDLEKLPIPLPSLPEQHRIAAILDKADALRAKRREALEQLNSLAHSIFMEIFGDPRTNPKKWNAVNFGAILARPLRNGISPSTVGNVEAEVLTLSSITGTDFDEAAIKRGVFKAKIVPEQIVDESDFLICRGNGNIRLVGKGYFPTRSMPGVAFPDTIIAARIATDKISREYLEHLWGTPAIRAQIEAVARTTNGTFKVNQTMIEQISLMSPPIGLQREFSKRVSAVARLRAIQRKTVVDTQSLFTSLQHQAFTNKL